MKITLCVSVPNMGERFLHLLARAAAQLASGEHVIDLHYTCHDAEQHERVRAAGISLPVSKVHIIARENRSFFHANSITHSRCVNALFHGCDSDIAAICDYDTAFVSRDWDRALVDSILNRGNAFFGAPYSSSSAIKFPVGGLLIPALKYQSKPNCIFVAYAPARIKALTNRLCAFAEIYASPEAIPLRFISNATECAQYGLPIGHFAHIDTGNNIPSLIESHQLTSEILERKVDNYVVVRAPADAANWPEHHKPEEYFYGDSPYLVHFRKGASKTISTARQMGYSPEDFSEDVNARLNHTSGIYR